MCRPRRLPQSCTGRAKRQAYDERVPGARRRWELQQINTLARCAGIRKPRRRTRTKQAEYYKRVASLPAALPYLCAGMDMGLPWDTSHLHWAITQREHEAVMALLDAERIDVDESVDGDTALMAAVRAGDPFITDVLLERGADTLVELRPVAEACGTYEQLRHVILLDVQ